MAEETVTGPKVNPEAPTTRTEAVKEAGAARPELPQSPEHKVETDRKYSEILSKVSATAKPSATATDEDVILDAKQIGALTDEASKIQKLIDLAETKGVAHAVKVARSFDDYYALDQMHDQLADKFYQGLLEKGLITKD